ncbi:MAG: site-specific DNA-methyltransferase [Oscillospiraceae bacterium]|nr:site-specific DNA-methyltransferase [Oscillospiraceae bacterium]
MLYQIAPSCFTEARGADGKVHRVVNFDVLRQLLGDAAADTGEEFYQFTWPGKAEARREAARSIRKTLRPVPEDSVDWDTTQNLYIEGDNLEVLKLLQKSYMGKVKMIYIDPPYNTGNDFVYNDDFAATATDHDRAEGNTDELGNRYRKNTDSNGRFHSDWCSMIYPRLQLARNLLSEDGAIFISIDYNEFENLKKIMDEVFGADNFQREIIWRIGWLSGYKTAAPNFIRNHDTILFYTKNASCFIFNKKYIENKDFKPLVKKDSNLINKLNELGLDKRKQEQLLQFINHENRPERYPIEDTWNSNEYDDLNSIAIVSFSGEKISKILGVNEDYKGQKSIKMLMRLFESTIKNNDIILDFFAGSASTAHAVLQYNMLNNTELRYIMIQLPEPTAEDGEYRKAGYQNLCEIGKERIRRAGRKIKEEAGLQGQNLDIGFRVFRVDESNMEDVYFQPAALNQDKLDLLLDNVKPDRTDLDLLFGAMLDWGVQLSLPMSKTTIDGCDVYTVNDGDLVACFAENITENVIAHIADQSPLRVLFRDSCFKTDADKINIFEQFKQLLGWSDEEAMKNIRVI